MICHFDSVSRLGRAVVALCCVVSALVHAVPASAADFDFNVANGNYNVAGNWYNYGDPIGDPDAVPPVPPTPPSQPSSPPGVTDNAYVRNGGQLLVNSDWQIGDAISPNSLGLRIGWRRQVPVEDPDNPGTFLPDTFAEMGGNGSMLWTAGEITGNTIEHPDLPGFGFMQGGPVIRVGHHTSLDVDESTELHYTGTVIQNGPTTKILLQYPESRLRIGDHDARWGTPNPTSSYTLVDGTIGTGIGASGYDGGNENNGIDVRNGYFTMTGGQIIDATPASYFNFQLDAQRFLTISSKDGESDSRRNYAEATISGGNIDVLGGIRVATGEFSKGVLNINGPVTIKTGGDSSIGYNDDPGMGIGEMNMSDGTLYIGRNDIQGNRLRGRFQVGHRSPGRLNMSGGSIIVVDPSRDVRVGADGLANDSEIYMTGGTITTSQLTIRNELENLVGQDLGARVILDGPSAVFTVSGGQATIGNHGKGKFEVRQGTALLGGNGANIQLAQNADSEATLNVMGGKLTLGGPVLRSNLSSPAPTIGLTGGTLEFNNTTTTAAHSFQADLTNTGTHLVTKPDAQLQVNIGRAASVTPPLPAIPANFSMSGGSWDIDIGSSATPTLGADWFNVPNGTASLTGGTLNINLLPGFTPADNQVFRILRGSQGVTLDSGAVAITGDNAANWVLQENLISGTNEEILLKYVANTAVSGDFNNDGTVNAADYVVWRKDQANHGGAGGYTTWAQNFGRTNPGGGSGGAVPEPASVVLLGLFAFAGSFCRGARIERSCRSSSQIEGAFA